MVGNGRKARLGREKGEVGDGSEARLETGRSWGRNKVGDGKDTLAVGDGTRGWDEIGNEIEARLGTGKRPTRLETGGRRGWERKRSLDGWEREKSLQGWRREVGEGREVRVAPEAERKQRC